MTREFLHVDVPGGRLAGETWAGARPTLVLLHSGVTDRRSWYETADRLSPGYSLVAYDRRGFGQSVASSEVFSHVKDLSTLLDALDLDQVWLVASSAGGRVALDATLTHPERVAGLVLLGHPAADRFAAAVTALAAGRTTELSRALLRHAAAGRVSTEYAAVLHGLVGERPLAPAIGGLLSTGATSGRAMALGLCTAIDLVDRTMRPR